MRWDEKFICRSGAAAEIPPEAVKPAAGFIKISCSVLFIHYISNELDRHLEYE